MSNTGMCIRSLAGVRHVSGTRRERRRWSKAGPTLRSPSNAALKTTVGPASPIGGRIAPLFDQQDRDAPHDRHWLDVSGIFALGSPRDRRCFTKRLQREESRASRSLSSDKSNLSSMLIRTQAEPLSAKADGKPPALSPISNRLRAKKTEADLMSRHVPLLRWTHW